MTMPSSTKSRHGMAARADLAGVAFRLPADLNLAMELAVTALEIPTLSV